MTSSLVATQERQHSMTLSGRGNALLKKVSEGGEQEERDDVPVDDEHYLADAHVERGPRDHVEPGVAELQGQHGHVQLEPLRHRAPHPPSRSSTGVGHDSTEKEQRRSVKLKEAAAAAAAGEGGGARKGVG